MATATRTITFPQDMRPTAVLGANDEILRVIEEAFPDVTFVARANRIEIQSFSSRTQADAARADLIIEDLIDQAHTAVIDIDTVKRLIDALKVSDEPPMKHRVFPEMITRAQSNPVRPKTPGQMEYVRAIDSNIVTFGIGPAGTGKTYLAVAKAVQAFESRKITRIILTRPAVEAGENLGFLPGTLNEKIDPYLRPLQDALIDMLGTDKVNRLMYDGTIEVAPLAYMRGRTLNDAFVILDEAQNTTEQQMKMFLTRLGFNTRMVITGDVTQVDLGVRASGLRSIEKILGTIDTIAFVRLGAQDVVRHELVGKIVNAYETYEGERLIQEMASNGTAGKKTTDKKATQQ